MQERAPTEVGARSRLPEYSEQRYMVHFCWTLSASVSVISAATAT